MRINSITFLGLLFLFIINTSCSNDDDTTQPMPLPSMTNIEIGYGNNQQGIIGRDFHLNAEVTAGDKIDLVKINIDPIEGEEYTKVWNFEIIWDEFKGLKNSIVHKHFDIPADAPEGTYDFIITITDENGTELKETFEFELIDPANLAVDPYLYFWDFHTADGPYQYVNELLENPDNVTYTEGNVLESSATINDVKGDGKIYLLFIKKNANHLPETIDDIDFSKAVVYDVFEHKNQEEVDSFSNVIYPSEENPRPVPPFTIGAEYDNNTPEGSPINGEKSWESGVYYFVMIYTNTTYDISIHHYLEVNVVME